MFIHNTVTWLNGSVVLNVILHIYVLLIYFEFYTFDVYNVCVVNFVIAEFRATLKQMRSD